MSGCCVARTSTFCCDRGRETILQGLDCCWERDMGQNGILWEMSTLPLAVLLEPRLEALLGKLLAFEALAMVFEIQFNQVECVSEDAHAIVEICDFKHKKSGLLASEWTTASVCTDDNEKNKKEFKD